ncbi:MAG: 3'-5' exonuclease [Bdellovibrionales bacterium]|nr:3'-5' exonuclease [Bdellovibrionales bacterium]
MLQLEDQILIAFDTETTGANPVAWEVCEIAAVKWQGGRVVDEFQSLIRIQGPMNPIAQKIHKISPNDLLSAPEGQPVYEKFLNFVEDGILIAHHAPFDMGFVSAGLERFGLPLPENRVICSSLLSRKLIRETPNHRLQTLVKTLNLTVGNAHRALDDALNSLEVVLKCLPKMNPPSFEESIKVMGVDLKWSDFSIEKLKREKRWSGLVHACEKQDDVELVYEKGSKPGRWRTVKADGIVRSPNGDYFVGIDCGVSKRFELSKISDSKYL